jgi:hypothetical protein
MDDLHIVEVFHSTHENRWKHESFAVCNFSYAAALVCFNQSSGAYARPRIARGLRAALIIMSKQAIGFFAIFVAASTGMAQAQTSPWQIGDKVELQASGNHWQKCVVTDPGDANRVVRLQCEPYEGAGYSRGGGVYTETITSKGVRRAGAAQAQPTQPIQPIQSNQPTQPVQPVQGRAPAAAKPAPASGGSYQVGQKVEIEASQHWVPCTVSDIQNYDNAPLIRVQCPAYPALSRAEGVYIVHNNETGIRPATGKIGPAPQPAAPVRAQPGPGNSLRVGAYACYGSGGQIMAGLKFNITGPGQYRDAYGAAGTYSISGGNVSFRGGAMDGMSGRELKSNNSFRLGSRANCELWG